MAGNLLNPSPLPLEVTVQTTPVLLAGETHVEPHFLFRAGEQASRHLPLLTYNEHLYLSPWPTPDLLPPSKTVSLCLPALTRPRATLESQEWALTLPAPLTSIWNCRNLVG